MNEIQVPEFASELLIGPGYSDLKYQFLDKSREFNLPLIGIGDYSAVLALDDKKVFALDYSGRFARDPLDAKFEFYAHQVLHGLYPDFFPKFHGSFSASLTPDGKLLPGGTVRERIYQGEGSYRTYLLPNGDRERLVARSYSGSWPPSVFFHLMTEWIASGLPLDLDGLSINFGPGPDGSLKYLDNIDDAYTNFGLQKLYDQGNLKWWDFEQFAQLVTKVRPDQVGLILEYAKKAKKYYVLSASASELAYLHQKFGVKITGEAVDEQMPVLINGFCQSRQSADVLYQSRDRKLVENHIAVRLAYLKDQTVD